MSAVTLASPLADGARAVSVGRSGPAGDSATPFDAALDQVRDLAAGEQADVAATSDSDADADGDAGSRSDPQGLPTQTATDVMAAAALLGDAGGILPLVGAQSVRGSERGPSTEGSRAQAVGGPVEGEARLAHDLGLARGAAIVGGSAAVDGASAAGTAPGATTAAARATAVDAWERPAASASASATGSSPVSAPEETVAPTVMQPSPPSSPPAERISAPADLIRISAPVDLERISARADVSRGTDPGRTSAPTDLPAAATSAPNADAPAAGTGAASSSAATASAPPADGAAPARFDDVARRVDGTRVVVSTAVDGGDAGEARAPAAPTPAPGAGSAAPATVGVAQPVPVAPTGAPTGVPAVVPDAPRGVAAQIAPAVLSIAQRPAGTHQLTMTVNPDSLGPVTVRAHIGHAGDVQLELVGGTDAGRDALRSIVADLRRDLAAVAPHATLAVSTASADANAGRGGQPGADGASSGQGAPRDGAREQSDRRPAADRIDGFAPVVRISTSTRAGVGEGLDTFA